MVQHSESLRDEGVKTTDVSSDWAKMIISAGHGKFEHEEMLLRCYRDDALNTEGSG